jgi:uncharacterized protein DUF3307
MEWTEAFAVFIVSHLVGDYLLQTEWQALNKHGGLGRDPVSRRALLSHISTYTLAFVPATVWLAGEHGAAALGLLALIAITHLIQDDGRLLSRYIEVVKRTVPGENLVFFTVDQSFHVVALFLVALLAGS